MRFHKVLEDKAPGFLDHRPCSYFIASAPGAFRRFVRFFHTLSRLARSLEPAGIIGVSLLASLVCGRGIYGRRHCYAWRYLLHVNGTMVGVFQCQRGFPVV